MEEDKNIYQDKADELGVPLIRPNKPQPSISDTVAVCGQCGLELKRVMGYVCGNSNCPVQPKVTC